MVLVKVKLNTQSDGEHSWQVGFSTANQTAKLLPCLLDLPIHYPLYERRR